MGINVKKLSFMALFSVVALTIFILESFIPMPFPPGIKPGFANIITLFLLFLGENWKVRDVFMVFLTRTLLAAFITGQGMSLIYSFTGGVSALLVMAVIKKILNDSSYSVIPIVSVTGALTHNLGQITTAALLMQSKSVLVYLPALVAGGIISGLLTGFAVWFIFKAHPKFINYIKNP